MLAQAGATLERMPVIPAMTTDAERECYYRLVRDNAANGAIVELGAWLGASTAYIAAGIRDSGVDTRAQVYDKFQSKPGHAAKVAAFYEARGLDKVPMGPCLEDFLRNLGPLIEYVEPHPGQIEDMRWSGEPIAVLITDAPKRVPAISAVLTKLGPSLHPGAVMAWQDFCHFPSYEIPACLYRLRDHLSFVEAIVPGTTLVFRVDSIIDRAKVTLDHLSLDNWTPNEVAQAWNYWLADYVPEEKKALFRCGAAMFLCDLGYRSDAIAHLKAAGTPSEVVKKWRYLRERRPDFVKRYAVLFEHLRGVL